MCDALAENLCEKKKKVPETVTRMTGNETNNSAITPQTSEQQIEFEDLEIPDNQIMDILTQIGKENQPNIPPQQEVTPAVSNANVLNVSNVSNIANVAKNPFIPPMYISNSSVTINYNFCSPK